jgi:hypothetical protein
MEQPAALHDGGCEPRSCQGEDVRRHAASAHAAAGLQRRTDVDRPVQDGKRACGRPLEHAHSLGPACFACLQRVHENVRYVKLENSAILSSVGGRLCSGLGSHHPLATWLQRRCNQVA